MKDENSVQSNNIYIPYAPVYVPIESLIPTNTNTNIPWWLEKLAFGIIKSVEISLGDEIICVHEWDNVKNELSYKR